MKRAQRKRQIYRRCFLLGAAVVGGIVISVLTLKKGEAPAAEPEPAESASAVLEEENAAVLGGSLPEPEDTSEQGKDPEPEDTSEPEIDPEPEIAPEPEETPEPEERVFVHKSETLELLRRMGESNPKIAEILEQPERYPEELLEAVAYEEELADFALAYPEKKDIPPADSIEELQPGEIPELFQWDDRWGYVWYGDGPLGVTGCGPTTLAMAAAGLTGNEKITPAAVAEFAEENGYYVEGTGTSWRLMEEGCEAFGLRGREMVLDKPLVFAELEKGNPVICSMKPGDFTIKGHFILLTGLEEGKIRIHDPFSRDNNQKRWEYEELEPQINNLWVFEKIS